MFFGMFNRKPVKAETSEREPSLKETTASGLLKGLPLQYEQFSKEWQSLTAQDNFDGFRVEAGKNVTKNLQASHSLILGTGLRDCGYLYQFGPTYHSADGKSFATARVGLDSSINGRLGTKLTDSVEVKIGGSSNLRDSQRNALELEASYSGSSITSQLKLLHQNTWIVSGAFTQEISDNLWLGTELTYIPVNGVSITSYGGRYVAGPHVINATIGQSPDFKGRSPIDASTSLKVQYVKKVSDRLSLGVELETSLPEKESALKCGYDYTFRQARVQGMIDTSGKVSCFVSDYMGFGVSGMIDYVKGDYRFGFMMHIAPQPESATM
jgi:mitochondrial import receptor subunit TOM40